MSVDLTRVNPEAVRAVSGPANRIWAAGLTVLALIGISVGAVVGSFAGGLRGGEVTASALVRIAPPADLSSYASGAPDPRTDASTEGYVSGEVAYLSSPGFARAVGDDMGKVEPAAVAVTRNADSPILTISSSAPNAPVAVKTVDAAIAIYRQQVNRRMDEQLSAVMPRLDGWELSAADAGDSVRQQEVRNLRDVVALQAAQSVALEVVQPATVDEANGNTWVITSLFGGLLGGLIAILGCTAYRSRSNRLRSAAEVTDVVDGLIVPAVDLRTGRHSRAERATLARTLYAQCSGFAPKRVFVVIGASKRSGTATVADLLARAAAEHGPVSRGRLAHSSVVMLSDHEGDATIVIDAGAIGESALAAEAISAATDLIVVGRLNVDTVRQVLAVRSATAMSDQPLMAVFTYQPWWSPKSVESVYQPIIAEEPAADEPVDEYDPAF